MLRAVSCLTCIWRIWWIFGTHWRVFTMPVALWQALRCIRSSLQWRKGQISWCSLGLGDSKAGIHDEGGWDWLSIKILSLDSPLAFHLAMMLWLSTLIPYLPISLHLTMSFPTYLMKKLDRPLQLPPSPSAYQLMWRLTLIMLHMLPHQPIVTTQKLHAIFAVRREYFRYECKEREKWEATKKDVAAIAVIDVDGIWWLRILGVHVPYFYFTFCYFAGLQGCVRISSQCPPSIYPFTLLTIGVVTLGAVCCQVHVLMILLASIKSM